LKYNQPYGISDPNAGYINGDPSIGLAGSIPPAVSIEYPQRELANFITDAGITPDNADLRQLARSVQRGKVVFAVDTGTADAMVVTLTPPLLGYADGLHLFVQKAAGLANVSTTPQINVNGLGNKQIIRQDGAQLVAGDLMAGAMLLLVYRSGVFWCANFVKSMARFSVPFGNPTLWVRTDGNDANDGSANDAAHAFATIGAAIIYAQNVWSLGGKKLIIALGNTGTYDGFQVTSPTDVIEVVGNDAAIDSYIIGKTTSPPVIIGVRESSLYLHGCRVKAQSSAQIIGVSVAYGGAVVLGAMRIETNPSAVNTIHMSATGNGAIDIGATVGLYGPALVGCYVDSQGSITTEAGAGAGVIACNANGFVTACLAAYSGVIACQGTFSGTATGVRGHAEQNGVVNTGAQTIPGNAASTTATGGLCITPL
jgi:hypothetical protein